MLRLGAGGGQSSTYKNYKTKDSELRDEQV